MPMNGGPNPMHTVGVPNLQGASVIMKQEPSRDSESEATNTGDVGAAHSKEENSSEQHDHSRLPSPEGTLVRDSSQTSPTSRSYDESVRTTANNGGEAASNPVNHSGVPDDGRAFQLPPQDPKPVIEGVTAVGDEIGQPETTRAPSAEEFPKERRRELSAAADREKKNEAGSQCGCTTPFRRIFKLLRVRDVTVATRRLESTSAGPQESNASGSSFAESHTAGSSKPHSAVPELPTSANFPQSVSDPTPYAVAENETVANSGESSGKSDLVFHELPRETNPPPVGRPSPIHNLLQKVEKTTLEYLDSCDDPDSVIGQLPEGTQQPPPTGLPSSIHNLSQQILKTLSECQHPETCDESHLVIHQFPRGTKPPPIGSPSPIHNKVGQAGQNTSDTQYLLQQIGKITSEYLNSCDESDLLIREFPRGIQLPPTGLPSRIHNLLQQIVTTISECQHPESSDESPLEIHELPRGTQPPPIGSPSPIHNKVGQAGQNTSDTPSTIDSLLQLLEKTISEYLKRFYKSRSVNHELPRGTQLSPTARVTSSSTAKKSTLSSGETMPRNTKPHPSGPSHTGNKMRTTDLQEFAAPSTILDREILEGFSTGSSGSQPEHMSNDELDTAHHETKMDRHQGDSPVKNEALGEVVGHESTDTEPGVGNGLESLEATTLSVPSSQNVLPEKRESSDVKDSSAKIEAPIEESPGAKQTAKIEAPREESPDTKQTANIEVPTKESLGTNKTGNARLPS